ncbi:MAG: B12-binding domain-containing radical SAM protein [Candidatus Omnitrophica bacterium]|nr:B12-binding domain-containing radical SAM protein [Candidatus Omnitrophota bacterium]
MTDTLLLEKEVHHKRIPTKHVDVVLVYPKTGMDFGSTIAPPHAILALAAPLREKGYNVRVLDQRVNPHWREELKNIILQQPICVGLSSMTGTQIGFAVEAAKIVRKFSNGKVPIVWGGPHPSSIPDQTVQSPYVDVVVKGEGDITFMELVERFTMKDSIEDVKGIYYLKNEKVMATLPRPMLDVETLLPVPWDLLDVEKYIHRDFYLKGTRRSLDVGQTSRGCPFQCGFCSSASLRQRKWRAMSVEKSLQFILEPIKKFNLDGIWIRDDEFYVNRIRAQGICKGIRDSGCNVKWYTSGTRVDSFNRATEEEINIIKMSGADTLKFGAESGSNRILDLMKKGIHWEDTVRANLKAKKYGIIPVFALMVGLPGETFEDIHATIDLWVRLKKDNPKAQFELIGTYTALPDTPLYNLAMERGLKPPQKLEDWRDWLSDEYDLEGRKIPWFNEADRKRIGNIAYMSLLANTAMNAIDGVSNSFIRVMLKIIFFPVSRFERFRLKHKWYTFAPELRLFRFFRRLVFYKREKSIL